MKVVVRPSSSCSRAQWLVGIEHFTAEDWKVDSWWSQLGATLRWHSVTVNDDETRCGHSRLFEPSERCRGRIAPGTDACLAHLTPKQRDHLFANSFKLSKADALAQFDLLASLDVDAFLLRELSSRISLVGSNFSGATFRGDVDFKGRSFTDTATFDASIFEANVDFASTYFQKGAGFAGAQFFGKVNLSSAQFYIGANFTNANFKSDASFSGANFRYRTYFDESVFEGSADFKNANFYSDSHGHSGATFGETVFSEWANFRGCSFGEQTDFTAVDFRGNANFSKSSFKSTILFLDSVFKDAARFDAATFQGPVHFDRATFASGADFKGATFESQATFLLSQTSAGSIDLSSALVDKIGRIGTSLPLVLADLLLGETLTVVGTGSVASLERSTLEAPLIIADGISMKDCALSHSTGLNNLRVLGTGAWFTQHRRQVIIDEVTAIKDETAADKLQRLGPVESSYRQLRAALESSKDYAGAADFYYGEMEMRRRGASRLSVEWLLLGAYKGLAGYGLRAHRALTTYFAVVLGFALLLRYHTTTFARPEPGTDVWKATGSSSLHFSHLLDCVAIGLRSTVSFLSPVTEGLTAGGTLLFVAMKLLGPLLLGLAALAIRARIQR